MRHLVIVESPAKAKTIEKFLGKDYTVRASFGHVRDLPQSSEEIPAAIKKEKWARLGVNTDGGFEPVYVIPADKQRHIKELKLAMKGADSVLLATDPDREGEAISWHLLEVLKPKVPVSRVVFHEITKEAITDAVAHPRDLDTNLVAAQETRRILDRLYGYTLSPILWKKVQRGLSAGRVQSVAVRLLVLRERERMAFVSAAFWGIEAQAVTADGEAFPASLTSLDGSRIAIGKDFDPETGKLASKSAVVLDAAKAGRLADTLRSQQLTVQSVEKKPFKARPAPPFSTSTLQQEANRKLGFSAKRTMQIAQQLYEGIDLGGERVGLITYMRTDSISLSQQAMHQAQDVIRQMFGAEYATGTRQYKTKSRGAQEAHEAIRPTGLQRSPQQMERVLDRDQQRVYDLIWKRTIASQMADAAMERTTAALVAATPDGEAVFSARGQRIVFPGFRRAYVEGFDDPQAALEDRDVILPALSEGQRVTARELTAESHETTPPARYTEASLVKRLEEEGIGRPSTYATILGTIQDRGYCRKAANALVPTFTAFAVTELLEAHFGDLVDLRFTARLEDELDEIAEGKRDSKDELRAFYTGTKQDPGIIPRVESAGDTIAYPAIAVAGSAAIVKIGRFGAYLQRGEGEGSDRATLPEDLAPSDLTAEMAEKLFTTSGPTGRTLGTDPATGHEVSLKSGRFGPYLELGGAKEDEKPKRASLLTGMTPESVTLEQALGLLSFPRALGEHPETNEPVTAELGRYGPYVKSGATSRSLTPEDDPLTVTLERAMELFSQPAERRGRFGKGGDAPAQSVLKVLGEHPETKKPITVRNGRYGPYVTEGKTFASLPKGTDPESVTLEQGLEWIAAKIAKGPGKKRGGFRRAAPKTTTKRVVKKRTKGRRA